MKLTQVQKVGFMAVLGGFATEEECSNYFLQTGEIMVSDYLDMTEKQQEALLQLAKNGLDTLNKLAETNL